MTQESDLRRRALAAHLAQRLGGPAQAILAYQALVVEQARELGLDDLLPDLEKVSGAATNLNRLLDRLIETGLEGAHANDVTFEAAIRHEVRTPLNAIVGYSEMIAEELTDSPHQALKNDVAVILSEAAALLELIDAIVDISRPQKTPSALLAAAQARSVAIGLEAAVGHEPDRSETGPGSVLVVDDVASNRDLLSRRLGRDGHQVVFAASGAEALARLAERPFDVVLLDMNGLEVLSRIKQHETWRRLPVIMISGLKETQAVIRCIEAGADDFLTKPFDPVLLRARIGACLQKKRWADREQRYLQRIEFEKDRADALLHAILPGQVVKRLNNGEEVIADWFESATILFADLVGFTPIAARMPADRLVRRLDTIFSAFDELAEDHGVEKIKTIGDAYMAAAGIPEPSDDHAERMLGLGRSMLAALERVDLEEVPFRIRVGIHTGPVIAGLLGRHRFVYDVWGETVNIASRLESHGLPGRIQISEATRTALKTDWPVEPSGPLDLKGIGGFSAYLLMP